MKVEMFGTHKKNAMPLSFSNFDFLPIYKADLAGSRTYPFTPKKKKKQDSANLVTWYF